MRTARVVEGPDRLTRSKGERPTWGSGAGSFCMDVSKSVEKAQEAKKDNNRTKSAYKKVERKGPG